MFLLDSEHVGMLRMPTLPPTPPPPPKKKKKKNTISNEREGESIARLTFTGSELVEHHWSMPYQRGSEIEVLTLGGSPSTSHMSDF